MIIHYINHNFTDWDSQTKHMSRIEKSIFLDLRTMYFGNASRSNGNIDGNDFELLCYRLSCKTEEEINALKLLLKDQFKKIDDFYINEQWDKQILEILGKYERLPWNEWKIIRERIFKRDNFTCVYCGATDKNLECDHVHPISKGGSNLDENLATACEPCNRSKKDKLLKEWKV